jgi:hypothetical protein
MPLGDRLSPELAAQTVVAAIQHPEWIAELPGANRVLPDREKLIKSDNHLADAVPLGHWQVTAEKL